MNLDRISTPKDLLTCNVDDLVLLCQEIRKYIIDVVSRKGGHLASNLGVVELTVALHYVFRAPLDKLIFDVSHQSYPHKLLTGRYAHFPSIRQFLGLCGFSNPKESAYDHFFVGHAGTALSLGLGMAKTRDMQKTHEHIIPIVGDAAFTCGLTLEALNNIPENLSNFLIVLNDNNMSISNNVGSIPRMLGRDFFESFGLSYQGPIDGHDLPLLIDTFSACKNAKTPLLVHALTTKGKGMPIATENPISYHGCKPFDKTTGAFVAGTESRSSFPQVFGQHILAMAEKDPRIMAVTPAMPAGSCLSAFMDKYPERCVDVGIAEGHAVTFCGGIAYSRERKVFMSIYATFLQRALDNLFQDVCLQKAPVIFAIDRAGISGPDGSTHHGIYDIAFLNAMPGMVICQPRNGSLLKQLMENALFWDAPCAIRYPNLPTDSAEQPFVERPIGKAELLYQGEDVVIIALGHMCETALLARDLLAQKGIYATIIDPIFVKPLDEDLLTSIFTTHKLVVTLEEHAVNSGLGSIINNFILSKHWNHLTVLNLGIPDVFVDHGSHKDLIHLLGLSPEKIAATLINHYAPCEVPL